VNLLIAGKQRDHDHNILLTEICSETIIEAYRTLRSNLLNLQQKSELKTLMVTSAVAEEGKTATAINLALSLKQAGQNVLLMDANLRKSNIADKLKLSKDQKGFSDGLKSQMNFSSFIIQAKNFENLDVLVSGTIHDLTSDDLSSDWLKSCFSELKKSYDWIIVDTAPASISDTLLMSEYVDGVLLCVRQYASAQDEVKQTVRNLKNAGANVFGTVMTRVDLQVEDQVKRLYTKQF
jgi:capsular exopolysaccharide synthesis family protein